MQAPSPNMSQVVQWETYWQSLDHLQRRWALQQGVIITNRKEGCWGVLDAEKRELRRLR